MHNSVFDKSSSRVHIANFMMRIMTRGYRLRRVRNESVIGLRVLQNHDFVLERFLSRSKQFYIYNRQRSSQLAVSASFHSGCEIRLKILYGLVAAAL